MYAFTYEAPGTCADATSLAGQGGQYLAGGQSLLPSMRLRLARPGQIVDLNRVEGLAGIAVTGQTVEIRAMTRHADVADNPQVQAAIPALAELAGGIGDRQVRARGTIGGSLANNDPLPATPAPCWAWVPPSSPTGARSRPTISSRACTPRPLAAAS
jgi:carbon-monoxide dehydrogenase medium subunit